jgi:protein-S-isoprenylcysteine O-methyltransferase Ste14
MLGMIAALVWLPDPLGMWAIVVLFAAAFVVAAAEERRWSAAKRDE